MQRVPIEIDGKKFTYSVKHYRELRESEKAQVFWEAWHLGQVNVYNSNPRIGKNRMPTWDTKLKGGHIPPIYAVTVCFVENENRKEVARGYAFCSCLDQFNKKIGLKIALGRAITMTSNLIMEGKL